MSTGFAGSRSMDERRRRRLASESSESLNDSSDESTSHNIARTHRFAAGQFPLRTLIFPKRWKLSLYYLPVFLCFSGFIAADIYRPQFSASGSALSEFLSLEHSPLPVYLTGALLFVSGQLSLLIGSLRTQSLHDFSGRHRLWKWVAAGIFLFAVCTTTQLHHVWASSVIELRLFDWGPHTQLLAWLIPALCIGLSISLMAYLEMRGDRAGLNFTIIAVAAYVSSLTLMLTGNLIPWEAHHLQIGAGLLFFAHWSLFTSLILHTHHLLYRSIDLPEKVPSRSRQLFANYLHRRRIKRKAKCVAKALKQKEKQSLKEIEVETKAASSDPKPSRPAKRASRSKPTPTPEAVNEVTTTPPEKRSAPSSSPKTVQTQPTGKQKPKVQKKNIRVDSGHDPELLKGLSKRERRKLQKQWREEERQRAAQQEEDWS
ncbi:hypothetical protein [Gimesia aquarii]|uniref:Uncharacterized protein n=1 Tax=Gimesia aquarii TaxID=2527964 RepID=A0A517WZF2_9PLAN|nr:hypothetical protein [Gimesia aquarii]QDU10636.1 hypothetical protein V202x_40480 [Gimesia aquarii]